MEDSQSPFAIPAAAIAVLLPLCFWLAVRYDRRRQNATVDLEIREEVSSQNSSYLNHVTCLLFYLDRSFRQSSVQELAQLQRCGRFLRIQ